MATSHCRQRAPADPNPDPNPNPNQAAGTQLQAAQLQLKDQLSDALRRRATTARTAQRLCASLAPRVQRRALMRCSWHALRMHVQLARSQRPAQKLSQGGMGGMGGRGGRQPTRSPVQPSPSASSPPILPSPSSTLPSSTSSPLGYPIDDAQWRRRLGRLQESAKFDRAALRDAVRGARHAAARQVEAEAEAEARGQQTVEAEARALRAEEQLRALQPAAYRLGEMEQQARDRVGRRVQEAASPALPAHPRYQGGSPLQGPDAEVVGSRHPAHASPAHRMGPRALYQGQGSPHQGSPLQGPDAEVLGSRRLSDVDGYLDPRSRRLSDVDGYLDSPAAGGAGADAQSSAAPPAAAARARANPAAAAAPAAAAPTAARARALLTALQEPGGADAGLAPTLPPAPPPTSAPLDGGVAAQAAQAAQAPLDARGTQPAGATIATLWRSDAPGRDAPLVGGQPSVGGGSQPAVLELGFFERVGSSVGSFFSQLQAEREQAAAAEREAAAAERAAVAAAAVELEEAVAFAEAEEQASVRRRSSAIAIQRMWIRTTSTYSGQAQPSTASAGSATRASLVGAVVGFTGEISPPSPRSAGDLTV